MKIENKPFARVPILLKNISQSLKDEAMTSGSKLFKPAISGNDSNFVSKIREAGFLFTGHTNTPEFGLKNITEPEFMELEEVHGIRLPPWWFKWWSGSSDCFWALFQWQVRVMAGDQTDLSVFFKLIRP